MNDYNEIGKMILALSNLLIEESINDTSCDVNIEIGAKIDKHKIIVKIERSDIE